jgi:hypothetical protein
MHEEFHAVTGRAAADTDFVVHRKCVRHRYAHWYYFFNSFENVLVHAPRYDGQTGVEGAQWMQHALAYARAYANAQGPV